MKSMLLIAEFLMLGFMTWGIGSRLSPEAIAMVLGLLFGVLAGLPVALLVQAAHAPCTPYRAEEDDEEIVDGPWHSLPSRQDS